MTAGGTLDIFTQIQALVSDKLQVVSYKWLSRKFSVSSNCAKRLLQEFVEEHGNELEVIYTLSGWLKMSPQTYCIRLASGINLTEVKQEFEDNCSVQVYSVQACIPNDLAVLWSAEFVQAEELFNQPSTVENCLRDNRFCGVSNSFVKRSFHGKAVATPPAQSKSVEGVGIASSFQPPQVQAGQTSGKHGVQSSTVVPLEDKSDKLAAGVPDQSSKVHVVKESNTTVNNSKRKGQNEKASSGNGGSLANLWGRAVAKSKPLSPGVDTSQDAQNVATQICEREAADFTISEEDGHDINCKRESNGRKSRKRKVILDFSDDDEENVVNLASPDPSSGRHIVDSVNHGETLDINQRKLFEEQKPDTFQVTQENLKEKDSDLQLKVAAKSESKTTSVGISLQEKPESHVLGGATDKGGAADKNRRAAPVTASTSPQRRKVLTTRTDERGREVTEVVWEGEVAASSASDKNVAPDSGNRPSVVNKVQTAGSNASSNPVSKAGNKKATKGGVKDAKQGNILSFFKKI